jgi:hypothetical protein
MWDLPRHTYEEVREVVIDVILNPISENITKTASNGWPNLVISVGYVFSQREKRVDLRLGGALVRFSLSAPTPFAGVSCTRLWYGAAIRSITGGCSMTLSGK